MYTLNRQLILEDGTVYKGYGFGADCEMTGEVVFNTSMMGYQKTLSDPSYSGQIVTFTYPLIGNYGISKEDYEAINPSIKGMVVREICDKPSNFQSEWTLDEVLKEWKIPGIAGIDTRALTRKIREFGTIKGIITSSDKNPEEVVESLRQTVLPVESVDRVSRKEVIKSSNGEHKVVVIDFGEKAGIVKELNARQCDLIVMPYQATVEEILSENPDGIVLSNGPGDPTQLPEAIQTIQALLPQVPIFGISLGHQLLALASGAKTYKLKFGHRGSNQPVKNLLTGRVDITSQNHSYAVDVDSLKETDLELTHIAVNDGTCEGIQHKKYPAFSVQYHPEADPGPRDANYLFDAFIEHMTDFKKANQ